MSFLLNFFYCVFDLSSKRILSKFNQRSKKVIFRNKVSKKIGFGEENIGKSPKEEVFFEGPPSKIELILPFISILTVFGIVPFVLTVLRQFWVSYKITNRRISVKSGFRGNDKAEITYRDIKKVNYIIKFGGLTADLVIFLKDNARLEIRNLSNWEKNIEFIKNNCSESVKWN